VQSGLTTENSCSDGMTKGWPNRNHYTEATVTVPSNQPPSACFTQTESGLTASFNGACSSDADGSVSAWSWDWGDGSVAGNGQTASHAYASQGTWTVTLTVTDNGGAIATSSQSVSVSSPSSPPANQARTTLAPQACSQEGSLHSQSGAQTSIRFYNDGQTALTVYWLDFQGHRVKYQDMAAGGTWDEPTYVSHAWLLATTDGACVAIFVAQSAPGDAHAAATPAPAPTTPAAQKSPIDIQQPCFHLKASDFRIHLDDGRTFTLDPTATQVSAHCDPGDATYTTVELGWQQNGVEMRFFAYLHSDGSAWWSNEVRTYMGNANPGATDDWLYAQGDFLHTPLGQAFTAATWDQTVMSSDASRQATVHFEGLQWTETFQAPPGAPTNLAAAPGNAQATLSWSAPVNGGPPITSYQVLRGTPQSQQPVTTGGCANLNALSCTDTGLANGQSYTYVVRAVNSVGPSSQSSPATVTPTAPQNPPSPQDPPNSPIPADGAGKVPITTDLSWTQGNQDPGQSPATFNVYLDPAGSSGPTQRCSTQATSCPNSALGGLQPGTTYTWSVTESNGQAAAINSPKWSFTTAKTSTPAWLPIPDAMHGFIAWETPFQNNYNPSTEYQSLHDRRASGVLIRAANGGDPGSPETAKTCDGPTDNDDRQNWANHAKLALGLQPASPILLPVAWTAWYGGPLPNGKDDKWNWVPGDIQAYLMTCAEHTAALDAGMHPPTAAWVIDAEANDMPGLADAIAYLHTHTGKPVFVSTNGDPTTARPGGQWDYAAIDASAAGWLPQLYFPLTPGNSCLNVYNKMTVGVALQEWKDLKIDSSHLYPVFCERDPNKVADTIRPAIGSSGISGWSVGGALSVDPAVSAYVDAWSQQGAATPVSSQATQAPPPAASANANAQAQQTPGQESLPAPAQIPVVQGKQNTSITAPAPAAALLFVGLVVAARGKRRT
jgi:PKD repeat protein